MLKNSGCNVFLFIIFLIIVIALAIDGDFGPLIYIILYISIPLILVFILNLYPSKTDKQNQKIQQYSVNENISSEYNNILFQIKKSKKNYKLIHNDFINGKIENENDLSEILEFSNLISLKLSCNIPTDISAVINNNKKLNSLNLKGPFYFKTGIDVDTITSLSLYHNPNTKSIIKKISINNKLYKLKLMSNTDLFIDDINPCINDLLVLDISAPLNLLPNQFFSYKIVTLCLNNCSIYEINDMQFENSSLKTIHLRDNLLNNIPLSLLYKLPNLQKIHVEGNPIKLINLKELKHSFNHKIDFDNEYLELLTFKNNLFRLYLFRLLIFGVIFTLIFFFINSYSLLFIITLFGFIFLYIYIESDIKYYRSLNSSLKYKKSNRIYLSNTF